MNISAYLKRLNIDIRAKNDFDTLRQLHRAHAFTIPFENFNVRLKRPIPLDKESLFKKLILDNRGGYCYELNTLFSLLLQELGFEVTHLIGRPLYGYNNALRPKTHMVLKVTTQGKEYLCDLGFGGKGLIEPIELTCDKENEQFGDLFKLVPHIEGFELQCKLHNNWVSLYSFDLRPQDLIDYELANFFNMHSPDSRFTRQTICAMPTAKGRLLLLDRTFKHPGSDTLDGIQDNDYDKILKKYFDISSICANELFDD